MQVTINGRHAFTHLPVKNHIRISLFYIGIRLASTKPGRTETMLLNAAEVAKHNTTSSCWIVVHGKVYDVTPYLEQHPGGAAILVRQGGRDATTEFRKVHSPDVLENLPKESFQGELDPAALASLASAPPTPTTPTSAFSPPSSSLSPSPAGSGPPHIAHCVTALDFEAVARGVLSHNALSYVSSSANSGLSLQANLSSWQRVSFRPRVLRDVRHIATKCRILGLDSPFPFYASAMGQLGRSHAGAEAEFVRGLARRGAHGLISTVSTVPTEEIAAALCDEQQKLAAAAAAAANGKASFPPAQLHFQLYAHEDRAVTLARIRRAKQAGFRSLWVTVDTPVLGKRTADRRIQAADALELGLERSAEQAGFGWRSHAPAGDFQPSLSWADLAWIREAWGGAGRPLVLKGVQCAEDVRLALRHGCAGVVLSNHGGRQAHSAPDALTTLLEIREYCPEVLGKLDILVDGGLRDGADVLKAICLGATAVGVGRPFFYALAAYGSRGIERCIDILSEELVNGMRLVGIASLDEAQPERVNASRLLNEMWRPEKSRL
ncbi:FMN-dependent dehydrogenase-domain-containing protein [Hypoxylon cercidicola]|nr:FMN-dependent dehydrogenase-domain-containing protein [Hypoxylon cercidicola]